jgi:hypothetical protein
VVILREKEEPVRVRVIANELGSRRIKNGFFRR